MGRWTVSVPDQVAGFVDQMVFKGERRIGLIGNPHGSDIGVGCSKGVTIPRALSQERCQPVGRTESIGLSGIAGWTASFMNLSRLQTANPGCSLHVEDTHLFPGLDGIVNARGVMMISTPTLPILQVAADMAAQAHASQTVRDTEIPYIAHPMRVALAISSSFGCQDEEVVAAALLHDTLEKTTLSEDHILDACGETVLQLVRSMTKDPNGSKRDYWERLKADVWQARLIKMADVLDHLDCPPEDLRRRIRSGIRGLDLAHSDEEPIVKARKILKRSVDAATVRLGEISDASSVI
ncbi:MAG: HD domain-containing protein [Verrucomicrobiaceae bacterium]|nr:MAG: HD domain-containing protein [Verrucomicrobiaceae bacterium]